MRKILIGCALFALALSGCSDEQAAGACTSSDMCERGQACQPDASCGIVPCRSASECIAGDETCLQEDSRGDYDPERAGVCTAAECRTDRDCQGGVCVDRACYADRASPSSCTCRDECRAGEACINGTCRAPLSVCSDTCECAEGTVCEGGACVTGASPCDGLTCPDGERCVDGACVSACTPACTGGQVCNPVTQTCEGEAGAPPCATCSNSDECGGPADACLALSETVTICGRSCTSEADCPSGFVCFATGDPNIGSQCIPPSGQCTGCLVSGCGAGQWCNPADGNCAPLAGTCETCVASSQCGPTATCELVAGARHCIEQCNAGTCPAGYTCNGTQCLPSSGVCGGGSCDRTCSPPLGILDAARCICVGCVTTADCPSGQECNSGGTCVVAGGRSCSTTAECDGGYCQGGLCVECLTPGDCNTGDICRAGACVPCDCPAGQRCTVTGACEEVPDPRRCTSDAQCVTIANTLGFTGDGAQCDPTYGCITAGVCNGSGGGGALPIPDLGFGGATDPFDAACPPAAPCAASLQFESIFSGSPSFFTFACSGCDPTNPSSCRRGETCRAPLIPIFGDTPYCAAGGGGGGFPFPFP